MFGLISPLGLAVVGLYLYVAIAIMRAELKADASLGMAFVKAATWPATIWNTIEKLYLKEPR